MTRPTQTHRSFSSFMIFTEVALTLVVTAAAVYGVNSLNALPVLSV
ncbi:MAG: hypothetical protein ACN4GT_11280 [Gammaproteobacteria bacterium]